MWEIYRVTSPFQWGKDHMAPNNVVRTRVGKTAINPGWYVEERICSCGKNVLDPENGCPDFVGDIWVVEAGHPRKTSMLEHRLAVPDASLPNPEDVLKERLDRSPIGAGRG
jgi:hypothetical protein